MEIIEEQLDEAIKQFFELLGLKPPKAFRLGECFILVGRERGKWHLSISHPTRLPTWEEIKMARYALIPDNVWMAMLLPPSGAYINICENCFHLWEVNEGEFVCTRSFENVNEGGMKCEEATQGKLP